MVKKKDVKAALSQCYKVKGLMLSADYKLVREVFHSGKTHACVQRGLEYGKEKK